MEPVDLLDTELPKNFNLLKNIVSAKLNKNKVCLYREY